MKNINVKKSIILFAAILLCTTVRAQSKPDSLTHKANSTQNRFAIGFNLNQYQHDFGVGANITSPYIARSIAFRLMGSAQGLQCIPKGDSLTTWAPYTNLRLSVVTRQFVLTEKISVYSEGGIVMIIPNQQFSSQPSQFGGFGVFGFEFHPGGGYSQFIEAGGIGTGSIADKAIGRPIYANGFIVSTGFRLHF